MDTKRIWLSIYSRLAHLHQKQTSVAAWLVDFFRILLLELKIEWELCVFSNVVEVLKEYFDPSSVEQHNDPLLCWTRISPFDHEDVV